MMRLHTFILQQLGSKVKVLLRGNERGCCVFVVCKTLSPYCFSIPIAACVYPGLLLTLAGGYKACSYSPWAVITLSDNA